MAKSTFLSQYSWSAFAAVTRSYDSLHPRIFLIGGLGGSSGSLGTKLTDLVEQEPIPGLLGLPELPQALLVLRFGFVATLDEFEDIGVPFLEVAFWRIAKSLAWSSKQKGKVIKGSL